MVRAHPLHPTMDLAKVGCGTRHTHQWHAACVCAATSTSHPSSVGPNLPLLLSDTPNPASPLSLRQAVDSVRGSAGRAAGVAYACVRMRAHACALGGRACESAHRIRNFCVCCHLVAIPCSTRDAWRSSPFPSLVLSHVAGDSRRSRQVIEWAQSGTSPWHRVRESERS